MLFLHWNKAESMADFPSAGLRLNEPSPRDLHGAFLIAGVGEVPIER
jgi:hypothetical protein